MKTKISSTKKLIGASVALLASIGIAASSTFAWFTTSQSVTVDKFSAQVVAGSDSLTMAVVASGTAFTSVSEQATAINGATFSGKLDSAAITKIVGNDVKLKAATTTDGTSFADKGGVAVNANQTTGGYISFRLIFRNRTQTGMTSTLHLDDGSKIDASETGKTVPYSAAQFATIASHLSDNHYGTNPIITGGGNDQTLKAYAAHAARVTFVDATNAAKIWAPNERNADGGNDNAEAEQTATMAGYYLNNLANDYMNDYFGTTGGLDQANLEKAVVAADTYDTNNQVGAGFAAVTGAPADYVYTSVLVNIWIEGTDGDCFDAILEDTFTTTMKFTVNTTANT